MKESQFKKLTLGISNASRFASIISSFGNFRHYSLGDIHVGVFVEVGINVAVDGTFVHVGGMVDVLIGLGKMLLKLLVIVAELIEDLFALAKSRVTRSLRTEECQQYLHLEAYTTEP